MYVYTRWRQYISLVCSLASVAVMHERPVMHHDVWPQRLRQHVLVDAVPGLSKSGSHDGLAHGDGEV